MAATMIPADTAAIDKEAMATDHLLPPQVQTPPSTTDEASHKESDDAASSSSLSELGDDILDEENRIRFEEAARAGAEAEQHTEVKPHHYENNIPIFQPVRHSTRCPGTCTRDVVREGERISADTSNRLWKSSRTLRSMSRALIPTACSLASSSSIPPKNGKN
jgi:hypothetical protein